MGAPFLSCRLRAARPLLAGALLACTGVAAGAQEGNARGMTVPAAAVSAAVAQTVWGVLGYTRWPGDPSPVQLCLVGETAHAQVLLAGTELPGGRRLQTRRISPDDAQPLNACHAVYAGPLRPGQWQRLMAAWPAGQPLLTISEVAADCATGGMFCLDITPQGVSFELNLDSMARSGVRVNPRVLGLARRKEGS
ncbi:YfiR family protein [Comamonas terrigena]|uniref:YfiR family protein n=1 Tax=Comamonas terrigena TaxID=32013 RepID=UPI002897DB1F|nr:YfiR family protein [Comamonas terrigena]